MFLDLYVGQSHLSLLQMTLQAECLCLQRSITSSVSATDCIGVAGCQLYRVCAQQPVEEVVCQGIDTWCERFLPAGSDDGTHGTQRVRQDNTGEAAVSN